MPADNGSTDSDNPEIAELQRQVRRQGELIDILYRRLGVGQLDAAGMPSSDGAYPDVVDAIRAGNLIQAIKNYREHTKVGLKEAKDAVEALSRTL
jgi:ribosomal protein L7/L12